jgi:hypothetical protein
MISNAKVEEGVTDGNTVSIGKVIKLPLWTDYYLLLLSL